MTSVALPFTLPCLYPSLGSEQPRQKSMISNIFALLFTPLFYTISLEHFPSLGMELIPSLVIICDRVSHVAVASLKLKQTISSPQMLGFKVCAAVFSPDYCLSIWCFHSFFFKP